MSIKAIFPAGAKELIVNGLHQWDYGRKLEIQAADLPALVEVHFACAGMSEAVVRSCAVVQGVAEAVIPDQCLEQTTPVVAWVYEVGESSGATIKTITLPIIARARPQQSETVPSIITDKYTELIAAINEQVETLKEGNVTVSDAINAEHAETAELADKATHATSAGKATRATALELPAGYTEGTYGEEMDPGLYVMRFSIYGQQDTFIYTFQAVVGVFAVTNASQVYLGELADGSEKYMARVSDNVVRVYWLDGSSYNEITTRQEYYCKISYKKICS